MWDRKELKEKGKAAYRANRVACIIAALLLMIASGAGGAMGSAGSSWSNVQKNMNNNNSSYNLDLDDYDDSYDDYDDSIDYGMDEPSKGSSLLGPAIIAVILVIVFLSLFLRTRLGLAIRATGNNPDMVRSSSINPAFTTTVGLCISNSFTALSGCLLAQSQKSVNIDIGTGMVTIALASLLIGGTFMGRGSIPKRAVGVVLGSFIFRLVYAIALRFDMPASMLKLVSAVIVVLAISGPYLKGRAPMLRRRLSHARSDRPDAAAGSPASGGAGSGKGA